MKPLRYLIVAGLLLAVTACDETDPASGDPSARAGRSGAATSDTAGEPTSDGDRPAPLEAYAGSASCRECHEEAWNEWRTSHHARAQRDLDPALDDVAFQPMRSIQHGTQLSFADEKNDRYRIITMGPDGEQQPFEPAGAIGVDPLWQYLIPTERGRVQVTELAFDPDKQEWFNVYGDEDRRHDEWGHWTQRGMNWNSMCADCHMTAYDKQYDPDRDAYDPQYLEQGVGCEACHGPMRDHVDWQEAHPGARARYEQTGEPEDPTIVAMTRDEHAQVCGSCHARRSDLTGNFEPGDAFVEHYELFLPDLTDVFYPDGQVREEDFEYAAFKLSAMHNWGVRCMDCHYWHSAEVARTDNMLCLRCHERGIADRRPIDEVEHSHHPPGTPGFLCKDCHMPQTVYMARHWRHDHGMTIPDPLLNKEHGIPDACTRCHEEEGIDWSIEYVNEWYGDRMERPTRHRARLLARLKEGDLSAVPGVLELLEDEPNANWRAVYLRFLRQVISLASSEQQLATAVAPLLKALDDPSPLVQANAIDSLEPLARVLADPLGQKLTSPHRIVRIKAAWALRENVDLDSRAGRDLMTYLRFNQDQPPGAFQMATLHAARGKFSDALSWYERSLAWDARMPPARHGYATALQALGRSADAARVLLEGASIEPNNALYPYWLGLLYDEMGEAVAARDALRAAVKRDDSHARYWYNLGLAEDQLGNHDRAFQALDRAEELDPTTGQYAFTRGTIYERLGQADQARAEFERALQIDPDHAQAARALMHLP